MQIVSGRMWEPDVHYEAPASAQLPEKMQAFVEWGCCRACPARAEFTERARTRHYRPTSTIVRACGIHPVDAAATRAVSCAAVALPGPALHADTVSMHRAPAAVVNPPVGPSHRAETAGAVTTTPRTAGEPAGLNIEQLQALQAAHHDRRRIRRAAAVATVSGWTLMTFAALTLLTGLFSLPAFLLGLGMAVVAWTELSGSKAMRHLDISAPYQLAVNQLVLAAMLCAYSGWGIFAALTSPSRYAEQMAAGGEVARMLEPIDNLHTTISVIVYVTMIVIAIAACGSTALYYFTRRGHMEQHLSRTPTWVVEAMRNIA
jgi:hypothetical protein